LTGTGVNPTLNVEIQQSGGVITPALLSGIQTADVSFAAFGAGTAATVLDFANNTGLQNVTWANAAFANGLRGLNSALANLSVSNTAADQTFTFNDSALAGGADSLNLTISNLTGQAGAITLNTVGAGSNYETVNLVSSGSGLNDASIAQNGIGLSTLNVSGSAPLQITNASGNLTRFNASTATGAITYTAGTEGVASYAGGSADDNFILGAGFTVADTVNGGGGTTDTITTTSEIATGYAAQAIPTVSNIEQISLTDTLGADLTTGNIAASINKLQLQVVTAAARTVTAPSGTFTITGDANSGISNATDFIFTAAAAGVGTTDVLNAQNIATAASNLFGADSDLVANGYETVNISTGVAAAGNQSVDVVTVTPTGAATSTLNISGANRLVTGVITANVINASGLTGTAFLQQGAAAVNVASITGSANDDTLVGDASSSIAGGAGADTITGGAGNDTLLGQAGNDRITSNAGSDLIDGGLGNDNVILAANLDTTDTVSGGEGIDTISLTTAAFTAAQAVGVTNFETLALSAAGGNTTVTLTNFFNNSGFTSIVSTNQADSTLTLANVGNLVSTLGIGAASDGDSIVFQRLVDTVSNALTIQQQGALAAAAVTAVTANDEETLNLTTTFNGVDNNISIATLTAGDLSSLNVSGAGAVTIAALTAAGVNTINANGSSGAVLINTQASAVNPLTVTAGTGGLNFASGTAADTITGSIANDNIWGWTGADTINVGSGTDTLRYSADQGAAGNLDTALYVAPVANSISTVGYDIVSGLGAGDRLNLNFTLLGDAGGYTANAAAETDFALTPNGVASNSVAGQAGLANGITIVRGTYNATGNSFVGSASGSDSLIIYDSNSTFDTNSFNAIIAIGYVANSVTGIGGNAGIVTLA